MLAWVQGGRLCQNFGNPPRNGIIILSKGGISMEFIQGENRDQMILFPESLDDYVDEDNAVRFMPGLVQGLRSLETISAVPMSDCGGF